MPQITVNVLFKYRKDKDTLILGRSVICINTWHLKHYIVIILLDDWMIHCCEYTDKLREKHIAWAKES